MEVKEQNPAWLNLSHPNYLRWKRARELSIERGKFVRSVINQKLQTKNLTILDLGSGEGGTSKVFSNDNIVISFDLSLIRLQRQLFNVISKEGSCPTEKSEFNIEEDFSLEDSIEMTEVSFINGIAQQLPFSNQSFDLIIIQDVIEHLTEVKDFYSEIKRVLKPNGMIYLSTPNKFSIFNFISDPHFGLPIMLI
ncbi:MAG: class I SAM-dependent methyltransferase [Ignavibacteriota bacterium]